MGWSVLKLCVRVFRCAIESTSRRIQANGVTMGREWYYSYAKDKQESEMHRKQLYLNGSCLVKSNAKYTIDMVTQFPNIDIC